MQVINKKARLNYEVIETYEVGVVLTGAEVKSIKGGQVSLQGARALLENNELWLVGMNVPQYKFASKPDYDSMRKRKLLLSKKEIVAIASKRKSFGLTLIPLSVYTKRGLIKIGLGLVRGKKKYEKREQLKKRNDQRQSRRLLK